MCVPLASSRVGLLRESSTPKVLSPSKTVEPTSSPPALTSTSTRSPAAQPIDSPTTAQNPRKMSSKHLIESLNALPLSTYQSQLLPSPLTLHVGSAAQLSSADSTVSPPLTTLSFASTKTMTAADFTACFSLIESTSSASYACSSFGWSPAQKHQEMRLPDLRYLLVKERYTPTARMARSSLKRRRRGEVLWRVVGFMSFMLTYEDGYEVVYCYEVHLAEALRGKGVGKQLMRILEGVGERAGVQKVMLTVLCANEEAREFYERLGYEEDEYSPGPRVLRGGVVKEADYQILSKPLQEVIRRPEHVTNKKRKYNEVRPVDNIHLEGSYYI